MITTVIAPESALPILFLPSVGEIMSLFYGVYSLIIVIAVGCREGGPIIRSNALCGHKLVGYLYNISVVTVLSCSILWFALHDDASLFTVIQDPLTFHLIMILPGMLILDLFVSRYSIRPVQVVFHGGLFLLAWATVFTFSVIGHYWATGYFSNQTTRSPDSSSAITYRASSLQAITKDNLANTEIISSSQAQTTVKIPALENINSDNAPRSFRALVNGPEIMNSTTDIPVLTEATQGLAESDINAKISETAEQALNTLKDNFSAEKTINNADFYKTYMGDHMNPYQDLLGWENLSWRGYKKPLIIGILTFIGMLVVIVLFLSLIEYLREILYRIYAFWRNTLCCVWCINCWNYRVEKQLRLKQDRELARELKLEEKRQLAEKEALEQGEAITDQVA